MPNPRSKFTPKGVSNKRKYLLSDYKPGRSRDRQVRKRLKGTQKWERKKKKHLG